MNKQAWLVLSLSALLMGCASTDMDAPQSYAETVLSRPQPKNEEERAHECMWIKSEVRRQQGGVSFAATLPPASPKRKEVMAQVLNNTGVLEARAQKIGCWTSGAWPASQSSAVAR
jgi:hypothetical protein